MEFKGSKTEENIRASLTGESLARNKYTFFAMQARNEGNEEIANLFEEMARNETAHAKIWFRYLNNGLGTTISNLQNAATGEFSEWSDMYPSFAKLAREEGFEDIAVAFERVAKIEKDHEHRFIKACAQLMAKNKPAKDSSVNETPVTSIKTVPGYRCMFCGATYEKLPDVCKVCEAIGSFEPCMIEVEG